MDEKNLFTTEDIAQGFYPLRPIQRWLINTHFNKAKSTMMNIGVLIKIDPALNVEQLKKAIDETLEAHDIFRCRFVFHPKTSELCQRFDGEIQAVKIVKCTDEEFEFNKNYFLEPYFLIDEPLYRIFIFETPTTNYLYMDFYHGIMDGTSIGLHFAREIEIRYNGKNFNRMPMKYADYILEELKIPAEELETGNKYWREMLKDFDEKKHLPPADFNEKSWKQNRIFYDFQNIAGNFFEDKAHKENIFFFAATMLAIAKSSGAKSSMLSLIHNGRFNAHERRIMGLMIEQYPVAWNFENDMTIGEFLDKLDEKINEGLTYRKSLGTTYLEGLQDDCATFIFQKNLRANSFYFAGKWNDTVELMENEWSAAENFLDIEINANEDGTYMTILDYDASRYSENSMKNFVSVMDEIILRIQNLELLISQILD